MAPLSLCQLLDIAISTSEAGCVNFRALHSLVLAVQGLLSLGDLPVPNWGQPAKKVRAQVQHVGQQPLEPGYESISTMLDDLHGQVSSLQGLARDLEREKGKIRKLEDALCKLGRLEPTDKWMAVTSSVCHGGRFNLALGYRDGKTSQTRLEPLVRLKFALQQMQPSMKECKAQSVQTIHMLHEDADCLRLQDSLSYKCVNLEYQLHR
ncbi:hypothetical protein AAES_167485 [Amazona aestiva]|uniref:Uncharacterized protein n=1 Tax=Amazona aestiva TaxID=12930 RepID=A0A0Q3NZ71_AMAAE|nr:hypothetical protein AAES_167485 [Amazona aestiva]